LSRAYDIPSQLNAGAFYSQQYWASPFTVPMFDRFLKRTMRAWGPPAVAAAKRKRRAANRRKKR